MDDTAVRRSSVQTRLFTIVVSVGGVLALLYSIYRIYREPVRADYMLVLVVLVLIASGAEVRIPGVRSKITLTDTFIYVGILILGPWGATILGSIDGVARSHRVAKRVGTLGINMAAMNLAVFASSLLAALLFGPLDRLVSDHVRVDELVMCLCLIGLITYIVNTGIVAIGHALTRGTRVFKTWVDNYMWTSVAFFAGLLAAGAICEAIGHFGFYSFLVTSVLALPILLLVSITYKTYLGKVEASNNHIETLNKMYLATVESLTMAIDAKDQAAQGHIRRVRAMAERLGRAIGYPEDQMEGLKAAALLHDVGKLAVPEHILNKPDKLSPAEFAKIMIHPVVAADILSGVEFPYEVVPIVKHHHEKYDGTGYPSGLKGKEIPLGARVLTIVDCYDALTHSRPHRARFARPQALNLMRHESGLTFDPALLDRFFEIVESLEEGLELPARVEEEWHSRHQASFEVGLTGGLTLVDGFAVNRKSPAEQALRDITSAQREVLSLYEISQTLGSALRLSEVLAIIAAKLENVANFSTLAIYLLEGVKLRAAHVTGKNIEAIKGMEINFGSGTIGWVAEHRQALINSSGPSDLAECLGSNAAAYKSAAVFPLIRGDSLVGTLALYSEEQRGYPPDQVRLLETISGHAATAVFNALAFERTQESALTDNLTGLPNSRYMYSFFEQERSRAERQGSPLVLLMMDLDGFKKVNDTYGHHVGDEILRHTAQVIRRRLRLGDTLIRYAGDEFVAVLHQATDEIVGDLKQRLQTAVDNFAHEVRAGRVARIGISIGHATYGPDGCAIDELMEVADQRMYDDKLARKRNLSRVKAAGSQVAEQV
ncbi:MAG: diguanylate cyclase [Blastocatellia bacterium]